jgi:hypothetical protein
MASALDAPDKGYRTHMRREAFRITGFVAGPELGVLILDRD